MSDQVQCFTDKENQHVVRQGYEMWTIAAIVKHLERGQKMIVKGWCRLGLNGGSPEVRLVVMRLKTGELMALACSDNLLRALEDCRHKWKIETLFANLKTKGFNMEDTHLTDRDKLSTLLAVLAMAVAMSVKTGVAAAKLKPIPVKKHGRKAWSLFALGLHTLRKIFAVPNLASIIVFLWHLLSPKSAVNALKSIALSTGV